MIVDTSALVSIIRREERSTRFLEAVVDAPKPCMSAASYLELGIVIDGQHDVIASARINSLIDELELEIVPVTAKQARIARQAYARFGKGNDPKAKLNFGDCFSYALAIDRDEPLLFKGDDFGSTDLRVG